MHLRAPKNQKFLGDQLEGRKQLRFSAPPWQHLSSYDFGVSYASDIIIGIRLGCWFVAPDKKNMPN